MPADGHLGRVLWASSLLLLIASGHREAVAGPSKYEALLTCGINGSHINILACFAKSGSYGSQTSLSVTRDGFQQLYRVYELANVPQTTGSVVVGPNTSLPDGMLVDDDGLHILLPDRFVITAQNSQEHLILGIRIFNIKTREIVFQQEVGEYGVIKVGN